MAEIIVIGGGAGGMLAAIYAAQSGAHVTLLERNEKLGKKIYITGKGRCNVTNDCDQEEFLRQVPRNPRFLYSALSMFSPQDMMALLEKAGCPVVVQRGRRVFPATEKASDVTRALTRMLEKNGVRIKLTQVEYSIMRYFMENPGKALSREEILDTVWGRDYFGELKIVDVNIRRLRLKIEDNVQNPVYITTVWGYGYKWGF